MSIDTKRAEMNTLAYDRNAIKSTQTITASVIKNNNYQTFVNKIVKQMIIDPRNTWIPHVNGWYYVNMVGGNWEDDLVQVSKNKDNKFKEFSTNPDKLFDSVKPQFGHLIKDINPPQLGIDYDTISGRLRNISIATRTNMTQEFSIVWKDNANAEVFKYHEFWYDYIDAHKKGFIKSNQEYKDENYFIDVPYFNAIWIAILKPLTFELLGLVKLMGVAPTNPIALQEILGQRGASQLTNYTINYKCVDSIVQMFQGEPSGNFYDEFMLDQQNFFDSKILDSLYYGGQESLKDIKLFG